MPLLPQQAEVNIGAAGHVDHGKTTLVEAITGVWTSAHSEELKRGITIKVGYADAAFHKCPNCLPPSSYTTSNKCPHCNSDTILLRVGSFVDAPGHESLMVNMLSGASVMDGAVLVISGNEPVPQPQTREHLFALQMLGGTNIIISQNKVDLLNESETLENYHQIKDFTKNTVAKDSTIIPISAQNQINVDAVLEAIDVNIPTPVRDPNVSPQMLIIRSFDINKPGIKINDFKGGILGGTLVQGVLNVDDEIELRPGRLDPGSSKYVPVVTKISSLGTSAGIVDTINPGGLIAVGTTLDPSLAKADTLTGSIVGKPDQLPPTFTRFSIDVLLFETAVGSPDMAKVEKINRGELLRLNVLTSPTIGTVTAIRDQIAEIELRRPVCANPGDKVAISRRINERWRLIGLGLVK